MHTYFYITFQMQDFWVLLQCGFSIFDGLVQHCTLWGVLSDTCTKQHRLLVISLQSTSSPCSSQRGKQLNLCVVCASRNKNLPHWMNQFTFTTKAKVVIEKYPEYCVRFCNENVLSFWLLQRDKNTLLLLLLLHKLSLKMCLFHLIWPTRWSQSVLNETKGNLTDSNNRKYFIRTITQSSNNVHAYVQTTPLLNHQSAAAAAFRWAFDASDWLTGTGAARSYVKWLLPLRHSGNAYSSSAQFSSRLSKQHCHGAKSQPRGAQRAVRRLQHGF